ncbi:uncharacterized protein H6S33_006962 [Morchella sextelata]|uniref:uncharacterized protein n=1 Tax=Morchella sextelata TaxID=1174677 RepID=UPI001D056691|nr:uncharacterized protein H6S33_006962 [Morchella sextelata]KAH0603931.1 hypothetical protein H6S33_006962 [Morchella sextelata]
MSAPPEAPRIGSNLITACTTHIRELSKLPDKRSRYPYRKPPCHEFGRFRLWTRGFENTPPAGDNVLDEVLEEVIYLREPTVLLIASFASGLLDGCLRKGSSEYPSMRWLGRIHLGSVLKREWKTSDAAIGELRECVDALFDVLSTLHNVMERRKERDRREGAIREETPARPACVRGEHWEVYQQYIQNRFPQAIRGLDIEGFARGNADCFDRLLSQREDKEKEQKARETAGEIAQLPPVLEGSVMEAQTGHQTLERMKGLSSAGVTTTFKDSGVESSATTSKDSAIEGSATTFKDSAIEGSAAHSRPPAPFQAAFKDSVVGSSAPHSLPPPSTHPLDAPQTITIPQRTVASLAPPSVSGLSCSIICSVSSEPSKRRPVPRGHGWSAIAIEISRKHVFADLMPYMCIRGRCFSSGAHVFYGKKSDWIAHDMACLREAHEGTGATTTDKLAHQMEDIRLLALPPAYRDEEDGGSCDTSTTGSVLDDTPREGLLNVRLHRWMQERPEGELRREGMEDQDDLEDQDALDDQDALENQDASEDQDVSEDQDALERAFWEEPAASPITVMGTHWEIYQQYIRDRFPHAREELDIEVLARGNAECYVRLVRLDQERGEEEEEMEQRQGFPSPGVATTFKDSGLRSSAPHSLPPVSIHAPDPFPAVVVSQPAIVPVNTDLAPPPSVSSLSRSTICSVLSEPSKRRLLPPVPEHSWRKYIFADLTPYTCIRARCPSSGMFYRSKRAWITHDTACLRRPLEGGGGATSTGECPLCRKTFGRDAGRFYSHVAHHLEDIRLFSLPPCYREYEMEEYADGSSLGTTDWRGARSAEGEMSALGRYLTANSATPAVSCSGWVMKAVGEVDDSPRLSQPDGDEVLEEGALQDIDGEPNPAGMDKAVSVQSSCDTLRRGSDAATVVVRLSGSPPSASREWHTDLVLSEEFAQYKYSAEFGDQTVTHHFNGDFELWADGDLLLGGSQFRSVRLQRLRDSTRRDAHRRTDVRVVKTTGHYRFQDLFIRELRAMITLREYTEHFVEFYGWHEGQPGISLSIAMEFLPEGNLQTYMLRNRQLAKGNCKTIVRQILEALHIMHQGGIHHGNLTPTNVLIASLSPLRMKLGDICNGESGRRQYRRLITNTYIEMEYRYESPESIGLSPDFTESHPSSVDMWALGMITYQIMTGLIPFSYATGVSAIDMDEDDICHWDGGV